MWVTACAVVKSGVFQPALPGSSAPFAQEIFKGRLTAVVNMGFANHSSWYAATSRRRSGRPGATYPAHTSTPHGCNPRSHSETVHADPNRAPNGLPAVVKHGAD